MRIDVELVLTLAEAKGYVPPEEVDALRASVARTEHDLYLMRLEHPDWKSDIDGAIAAFNSSDLDGARSAFQRIDNLISSRRKELQTEEARLKHAQATLLYSFEISKSAPLLLEAAKLAETRFDYWLESGRAQMTLGDSKQSIYCLTEAFKLARDSDEEEQLAQVLFEVGVFAMQGGMIDGAQKLFEIAFSFANDIIKENGSAGLAKGGVIAAACGERLGDIAFARGDYEKAQEYYEAELTLTRRFYEIVPDEIQLLNNYVSAQRKLAGLNNAQGESAKAENLLNKAESLVRAKSSEMGENLDWKSLHCATLLELGLTQNLMEKNQLAQETFSESAVYARDLLNQDKNNVSWIMMGAGAFEGLADTFLNDEHFSEAKGFYQQAGGLYRVLLNLNARQREPILKLSMLFIKLAVADEENELEHVTNAMKILELAKKDEILVPNDESVLEFVQEQYRAVSESSDGSV